MATHRHHDTPETPAEHLADLPVEPEMPQGDVPAPPEGESDSSTGSGSIPHAAPR